jgi:hypothetical protein
MTTLDKSILKRLANSYEAYEHFPFVDRFDQFKSRKMYFLEGMNDEEIMKLYHNFIFFHFTLWNKIYPKISKQDITEYYERRKKYGKS